MLFNSLKFLVFFPSVLLIYFIIPKKIRYIWLLVCSYYFYMCWSAKYALLIALSTIVTYLSGIMISKTESINGRKVCVALSFVVNIGVLIFFKYFDFIIANINYVSEVFGGTSIDKRFNVILPVGISFYTFQALSYTVDVYRKEVEPEYNPLKYALFVSFFPQLVAGPIERSKNLLKQVKSCEDMELWNYQRIIDGMGLMLWGFFLKMVIADRLAIFVDKAYDNFMYYGSVELIIATIFFAFQVYCDFASYSVIAVGAAKIMGFELMENFNTPYMSESITEFWRRWHISLSSWLRDYLYIPLGGSRCSVVRGCFNTLVTFLISGLWHGAKWTYIVWGGIHGIYIVIERLTKNIKIKICDIFGICTTNFSSALFRKLGTFILVDFAWIFFRAPSMQEAVMIINRMVTKWNPWVLFDDSLYNVGLSRREFGITIFVLMILLIYGIIKRYINSSVLEWFKEQGHIFRGIVYIVALVMIMVYGIYGPNFNPPQFVYFQF